MYREYKPVMIIFRPSSISDKWDQGNSDIITKSSPIRLIVGGRARLVRLARNHQIAIRGRRVCSPRARIIVRL